MGFTVFTDDLALVEVLLALVASLFAYAGLLAWWAIRTNDPEGVRGALRGVAIPAGVLGGVSLLLALWGEMTWPFLASDGLAGYNILFFDPLVLLGVVLLAYAISVQRASKLQYVGLLGLISGGVTAFYGWTGYTASPAFTSDPFDTLLLYAGFAAAGIFSFPATLVVDGFLRASEGGGAPVASPRAPARWARRRRDTAAAPPIGPTIVPPAPAVATEPALDLGPRCPGWVQAVVLLFPVFAALAALAAFWYFGVTLPGHLGAGAGAAP